MKQRIRLTEGDLHRIIRGCVNEALNELDWRTYASAADKAEQERRNLYPSDYGTPEYEKMEKRYRQAYDLNNAASQALSKKYGRNYKFYRQEDDNMGLYDDDEGWTEPSDWKGSEPLGLIHIADKNAPLSDDDWQYFTMLGAKRSPWDTDKKYAQRQKDTKASREFDDFYQGKNKYHKGKGWQKG